MVKQLPMGLLAHIQLFARWMSLQPLCSCYIENNLLVIHRCGCRAWWVQGAAAYAAAKSASQRSSTCSCLNTVREASTCRSPPCWSLRERLEDSGMQYSCCVRADTRRSVGHETAQHGLQAVMAVKVTALCHLLVYEELLWKGSAVYKSSLQLQAPGTIRSTWA